MRADWWRRLVSLGSSPLFRTLRVHTSHGTTAGGQPLGFACRADDGLTFGTNHDAGVCIHFADKVPSPLRKCGHSALTVTVADLEALTTALSDDDLQQR